MRVVVEGVKSDVHRQEVVAEVGGGIEGIISQV